MLQLVHRNFQNQYKDVQRYGHLWFVLMKTFYFLIIEQ